MRGWKGSIPIPADSANSPPPSFPTTSKAGEVGVGGGGAVVVGGGAVVTGGGDNIRYSAPSLAEDAPVHDGVDGGDANTNEDGGDAIVGSVGGNGGGEEGFYDKEEEDNNCNVGGGGRAGAAYGC